MWFREAGFSACIAQIQGTDLRAIRESALSQNKCNTNKTVTKRVWLDHSHFW